MGNKRVLLVEDEAVTAMDLKSELTRLGYEVPAVVARGEDAILAAAEVFPDLVLMDITLGGAMTGIEAAEKIRKAHGIPVVFLTAHTDAETIGRAKKTEPLGYLPKPCSSDALMCTIELALYRSEADAQRKLVEDQLRRVREQQRIILDNIGVGVLFTHAREIIWANPGLLKMFGYLLEEIQGRDTGLLYPDGGSCEKIAREGAAAFDRGKKYSVEIALKRKDGSPIWCHLVGQAVAREDQSRSSIWLLEDATGRRRMEQALFRSEEKYRTVADHTCDWEYWVGPQDEVLYNSPSCARISGRPAAAFVEDPALFRGIVHPDDLGEYDRHRQGAQLHHEAGKVEFRILLPDGSSRWVAHVCQPVRDDRGQFIGTRGSNRDISLRKSAEQERERSIAKLQAALAKVKLLSGFIPICASCKKIRTDEGFWQQIEVYVRDHSEAEFSHGICPDCGKMLYGDLYHEEE